MSKFSIIIPYQVESDYLIETIAHIKKLKNKNYEVIFVCDVLKDKFFYEHHVGSDFEYLLIESGSVSPAIKRDLAAEKATGDILAFIDDDAFPDPNWLTYVEPNFDDTNVCGVGGPQITPSHDTFWQKVSGAMFLSVLNGSAVTRYWHDENGPRQVDDWPTVNLCIRKSDFLKVGGFDSSYYPGEDTKLCHDLVGVLKKKIVYEYRAIVFHHRRSGFLKHMRQVGKYGLHRGFFAKKFPLTSLKINYFIPSLFFLFVTIGWLLPLATSKTLILYIIFWLLYLIALCLSFLSVLKKLNEPAIALATIPFTVGTHFWYGCRFIEGFIFTKDLKSSLGR